MAGTGFAAFTTTQGTATISDSPIGIVLADTDQGTDTIRAACKTAPATPYTLKGKFSLTALYGGTVDSADSWGGFAWRSASNGHLQAYGILNEAINLVPALFSIDFSDPTTYGGSSEANFDTWQTTIWISLSDDGTNASLGYSMDGINFNQLYSVAKSSGFLSATGYSQVCIFVSAHGSAAKLSLQSYSQTSP
jgi:hypothetical protein